MIKTLLASILSCALLFGATDFEDAYEIYNSGDYETSFKRFKSLAQERDDLDAAYILGYMYEYGEGCEIDLKESNRWYKTSSRGYYRLSKDDVTRDIDKEKRKLYKSLEKSGDVQTEKTIRRYTQSLYNLEAHRINYFLPVSYRHNGDYSNTNGHKAKGVETEFQVSIKYNFSADVLGLNEVYAAAYTQLAFWQLYEESAYFRETNYNPELFVTFPISNFNSKVFIKALRLSFAHQSNGRGGEEERSWNYLSLSAYSQYRLFFMELKLWHRLPDNIDYNPDLIDYLGHGHLQFILPYKKHIAKLLMRSNFSGENAVELNYSYPAFGDEDLFFYVKAFSGYGESLIDYDNQVNKIGLGFSISR